MQLDQQFTTSGAVQDTDADGELVLLDLDQEQFFGLNEAGAIVWRALGAGRTLREIITALAEEYEAPEERLREDVLAMVARFEARGWIRPAAGA